jgi:tRNA dimethylallyltransferase
MDIGTAKPTRPGDRASRHRWHLVDLVDPSEEFSVGEFQRAAARVAHQLHGAGSSLVLVGGTGLYHRAVIDRLELPPRYPGVLARLEAEAAERGEAASPLLHERLARLDPVAAGRMEPSNLRRVMRALEVTEGSGKRFSDFGPGLGSYPPTDVVMVGLALHRDRLEERLRRRLDAQVREGFVDEVRRLAARSRGLSRTARQAIGYREVLAYLAGSVTLEEALETTTKRLCQFAKRQEAWFRRDPRVQWLDAAGGQVVESVLARWETGTQ